VEEFRPACGDIYSPSLLWYHFKAFITSHQTLYLGNMRINYGTFRQWNITQFKKEALSRHEKTWRDLKCILCSERNQSEKVAVYCMIPTI